MQRDRRKENFVPALKPSRPGISIHVIAKTRKCVCGLILSSGTHGTGFFSVLERGDKIYKGLFTCNHLIDKNDLRFGNRFIVQTDSNALELEVQGFWFTDDDLDATFIELTKVQIRRLKVSDFLLMDYSLEQGDTIFLMQCPRDGDIRFASGSTVADKEDENMFYHNCDTDRGSSGSPLLNQDGEVLGIHCGVDNGRYSERKYAVRIAAVRDAIKRKLANADSNESRRSAERRELKQTVQELRQQLKQQEHETLIIKQKLQQQEQLLQEQQKQKSQNKQSKLPKADGKTAKPKVAINVNNSNIKIKLSKFRK